jgi:phosphopantothenoylcysteine decarboxylase/phosphopantothenate--cysteine ligase
MDIDPPAGVDLIQAFSGERMHKALVDLMGQQPDCVIMAAAVADFRPVAQSSTKIKKAQGVQSLELEQTTDILADICAQRGTGLAPLIFGFAAETTENHEELAKLALGKLAAKGADAIIVNNVSDGQIFGSDNTEVLMVEAHNVTGPIRGSKLNVAHAVVHRLSELLGPLDSSARKSKS